MNPLLLTAVSTAILSIACGPLIPALMLGLMSPAKRPVRTGVALATGGIAVVAVFVFVFLLVLDYSRFSGSGNAGYILYLVLGIAFLLIGLRLLVKDPKPADEKGGANQRLARLTQGGPAKLVLAGVVVALVNSDQLVVLATSVRDIAVANVPLPTQLITALIVVVIATVFYWSMPLAVQVGGEPTKRFLERLNGWIGKHERVIEIVVMLVLGAYFVIRAVIGLY
jgi:threonine/homoserine/homoserine lactone efflux protein